MKMTVVRRCQGLARAAALMLAAPALAGTSAAAEEGEVARNIHADRASYGYYRGDGIWRLAERIWLPPASDELTLGLFSMEPADADDDLENLLAPPVTAPGLDAFAGLPGISRDAPAPPAGLELPDTGFYRLKGPARAQGDAGLVPDGMHGGAVRLGGDGVITLPNFAHGADFTVEAWFKPEKTGGTLMHLPVGKGGALTLSLTADGRVELKREESTLGISVQRLEPGVFTHVAFVYRRIPEIRSTRWYPRDVLVFVDGVPVIHSAPAARMIGTLGAPLLGNSPGGQAPFTGLVDEVRVSSTARDFYAFRRTDPDPRAERPLPRDLPVIRGGDDLLLEAALDHSPAAQGRFAEGVTGSSPVFTGGMRGSALVVSPSSGMRFPAGPDLPADQGSVEFWFMPHDWDNSKPYSAEPGKASQNVKAPVFRLLVNPADGGAPRPFLTMRVDCMSATRQGGLVPFLQHPIVPGGWRHLVVAWRGHAVTLYVDGEEYKNPKNPVYIVNADRAINPAAMHLAALEIGGFGGGGLAGASVVDEVRLYRRRLTHAEAANACGRFLKDGGVKPLPPVELAIAMNHPQRTLTAAVDLLMPQRDAVRTFDLQVSRAGVPPVAVTAVTNLPLAGGSGSARLNHPGLTYGEYVLDFTFKDADGGTIETVSRPHAHPRPAWVDNTLGLHDGEVMPPWTPMTYQDGLLTCWGREIAIGGGGWPVRIVSQGEAILPGAPEIRLASDRGDIRLEPVGTQPRLLKQQPGAITTEGVAQGGGWTMTTTVLTEYDGFMKLQTRIEGPPDAEVRELRVSFPLRFADEQFVGFYTGGHRFRNSHDFRILPNPAEPGRAGSPLPAAAVKGLAALPGEDVVFASNATGRRQQGEWTGKVSFLPYVTVGDDARQFIWLAENDRHWTQSWTNPAITITRSGGVTRLNLNIVSAPRPLREPLVYTFGLQATPIKPLPPDHRSRILGFNFGQVCGFNGYYLQAPFEGHTAFLLASQDLDWSWPEQRAAEYRREKHGAPLLVYFDRTWQRAPEDALEYNRDWRGWGDATRYTRPVRDAYAWYINEWLRRGLMEGMYIDDAWIVPTKNLAHLDPADNLAYRKPGGKDTGDWSHIEWGFEFLDYREMLKRIRWVFLDNGIPPMVVAHATQTPYYPLLAYVDILLEGEDRYLSSVGEARDFITSWGLPRLRYASPRKWGVPVQWLPILGTQKLRPLPGGRPSGRWFRRQQRSYMAGLLLHDLAPGNGMMSLIREASAAGCLGDQASFIGYWEPGNPVRSATPGAHASVYRLPSHLALVLVNAGKEEQDVEFVLDARRIAELLGTDAFVLRDADGGGIPLEDAEWNPPDISKMEGPDRLLQADADDGARATEQQFEAMMAEEDLQERQAGVAGKWRFRHEGDRLLVRIQASDYRLLQAVPGGSVKPSP